MFHLLSGVCHNWTTTFEWLSTYNLINNLIHLILRVINKVKLTTGVWYLCHICGGAVWVKLAELLSSLEVATVTSLHRFLQTTLSQAGEFMHRLVLS